MLFIYGCFARNTGVGYIERVSGVNIPWPRKHYESEECDFAQMSFIKLSARQTREFRESNPFAPLRGWGSNAILLNEVADPLPDPKEMVHFYGAGRTTTWDFYLHETTGRLWVLIHFPDVSGDLPAGALDYGSPEPN